MDVIINNAGTIIPSAKLCDIPLDNYHATVDLNQNGAWYVLKYGIKLMESLGNGGRVVNMSSIAGLSAIAANYGAAYTATKGLSY